MDAEDEGQSEARMAPSAKAKAAQHDAASWASSVPPPGKKGKDKGGKKRGSLSSTAARAKHEKAVEREGRLSAKASRKETRRARSQAGRSE